jgi:MarR family transcriptional regulator, organic hydroperoxide resistance regulator
VTGKENLPPPARDRGLAPALGPVLDFMRLLWAVDHQLQSASKRMRLTRGVTGPQRLVVRVLFRYPGASAGELADALHLHPSTLTGVLDRLERARLIERRRDPSDHRRALFHLSSRGRDIARESAGTVEASVRNGLRRIAANKVEVVRDVLGMLAEELRHGQASWAGRPIHR